MAIRLFVSTVVVLVAVAAAAVEIPVVVLGAADAAAAVDPLSANAVVPAAEGFPLSGVSDDARLIINGTVIRCPVHEEFIDCPLANTCQRLCSALNDACVITPTCTPACFCREGMARDASGTCVPFDQCPGTSCPRNEEFIVCGSNWQCEKTCAGRNAECPVGSFCTGGCQCREGFVRDSNSACVKPRDCVQAAANPECPRHEIYRTCDYDCVDVCPGTRDCITAQQVCRSGCFCETGFVRIDGRCVPRAKCLRNCPAGEEPGLRLRCSESCDLNACATGFPELPEKRCICEGNRRRNAAGACVLPESC